MQNAKIVHRTKLGDGTNVRKIENMFSVSSVVLTLLIMMLMVLTRKKDALLVRTKICWIVGVPMSAE